MQDKIVLNQTVATKAQIKSTWVSRKASFTVQETFLTSPDQEECFFNCESFFHEFSLLLCATVGVADNYVVHESS